MGVAAWPLSQQFGCRDFWNCRSPARPSAPIGWQPSGRGYPRRVAKGHQTTPKTSLLTRRPTASSNHARASARGVRTPVDNRRRSGPSRPLSLSGTGFVVAYGCATVPYGQVSCARLCPSLEARHCASRWPRPGCPQANDSDDASRLRSHRQECRARQTAAAGGENINFDRVLPGARPAGERPSCQQGCANREGVRSTEPRGSRPLTACGPPTPPPSAPPTKAKPVFDRREAWGTRTNLLDQYWRELCRRA